MVEVVGAIIEFFKLNKKLHLSYFIIIFVSLSSLFFVYKHIYNKGINDQIVLQKKWQAKYDAEQKQKIQSMQDQYDLMQVQQQLSISDNLRKEYDKKVDLLNKQYQYKLTENSKQKCIDKNFAEMYNQSLSNAP